MPRGISRYLQALPSQRAHVISRIYYFCLQSDFLCSLPCSKSDYLHTLLMHKESVSPKLQKRILSSSLGHRPESFPPVSILLLLLVQPSPWFHQNGISFSSPFPLPQPTSGHASSFPIQRSFSGASVFNYTTHFPWNHIVGASHITFSLSKSPFSRP